MNKSLPKLSRNTVMHKYLESNTPTYYKSKRPKVSSEDFVIPYYSEWNNIMEYNHNVSQLKTMARHYKIKKSGNKRQLITRVYNFLKLSYYAVKLQSAWRSALRQGYNRLHGPAAIDRKCTNSTDFLSLDSLSKIPYNQFFSFKDRDGFIYGFDAKTFYNLVKKNKNPVNPYNRKKISENALTQFRKFLRYSSILNEKTNIKITNTQVNMDINKRIGLTALTLFNKIDSFGHITDANWFLQLSRPALIKLIRELRDIWEYRAALTSQMKRAICPPHGNPFSGINISSLLTQNPQIIKINLLNIFENLVSKSPDRANQALGAFYVLASLTLVSQSAAIALPWLYDSVSTNNI